MLKELIGAQIVSIDETRITVELLGKKYTLELDSDDGDCCGYADFTTTMLYSKNDINNPIITDIKFLNNDYPSFNTSIITFYGSNKELAHIESEAGSGSGWSYGACVSIRCKDLNIDESLADW